jgi:acyl-CoA thioester hydrolase
MNNPAPTTLDGVLRDGRHHMTVRVYYEDTDFSGIVYHANYLRFMERGRTNHLRLLGANHRELFEQAERETPGFAFVVRSMRIEFLKPARMDNVLDIVTAPQEVKGASISLHQQILRANELLVDAQVRVACISGGRARPIPMALRLAMLADQSGSAEGS